MSTEKYHNCEEIIARTKIFLNVHTGKDLAVALGVSENAISTWKKRGTLDMGKILLACEGVNQEWLLTGEGNATKSINTTEEGEEEMYRAKFEDAQHEIISLLKENAFLKEQLLGKPQPSKAKKAN